MHSTVLTEGVQYNLDVKNMISMKKKPLNPENDNLAPLLTSECVKK